MGTFFVLGKETRQTLSALAERAARPENWYRPGQTAIPGGMPEHCAEIGNCRIVFSWTVDRAGRPWRHMSMSTIEGRLPEPVVAFTAADLLGFTGAEAIDENGLVLDKPPSWDVDVNREEHCVVLVQPVGLPS